MVQKINFKEKKEQFLTENKEMFDWDDNLRCAFSFGVDCISLNYAAERDLPIVFCAYADYPQNALPRMMVDFLAFIDEDIDKNSPRLNPRLLMLNNTDPIACLKSYCRNVEDYGPTLFFTADHISWFQALPDGMLYVINCNGSEVTCGLNTSCGIEALAKPLHDSDQEALLSAMRGPVKMQQEPDRLHALFYAEAQSRIIRAIHAPEGEVFSTVITIESPEWEKEICVALRRYQAKECRDGFRWDTTDQAWHNIFVHPVIDRNVVDPENGQPRPAMVGYVIFEDNENGTFTLANAWLHPFYRREGRLSKMWPEFTKRYGLFDVDQPNSDMKSFLTKIGHCYD